jgi:hypothetical protein
MSVNEDDDGTPGKSAMRGNDQIRLMKPEGMTNDQMRIIAKPGLRHSNFKLFSSFEIGALSFLAGMRNCFPDPGRRRS